MTNVYDVEATDSPLCISQKKILVTYQNCFADDYRPHLPHSCGDLDHQIELFFGFPPPHKAFYRHGPLHQKEI